MFKSIFIIIIFTTLQLSVHAGEGCGMTQMGSQCKAYIHQNFGGKKIVWDEFGGSGGSTALECFGEECGTSNALLELVSKWEKSKLSNKNDITNQLLSSINPNYYKCPKKNPIITVFEAFDGVIPATFNKGITKMLNGLTYISCDKKANVVDYLKSGLHYLAVAYPNQNTQIKEAVFSHIFSITRRVGYEHILTKEIYQYPWISEKVKKEYLSMPKVLSVKWTGYKKHALKLLSQKDLRLYRNAVFAKYGMPFQDKNLQIYFSNAKWYTINKNYTHDILNATDKHNIKYIMKIAEKINN